MQQIAQVDKARERDQNDPKTTLSLIPLKHIASKKWRRKPIKRQTFRYFMMGVCQRGDTCPYSHDRSISNKRTIPCRFYQVTQ